MIRGGWNRSAVTVVTVGNGVTRRPSARKWQGRRPMELGAKVSHPSQTVVSDPGILCVATCPSSEFFSCPTCLWSESVD